MLPIESPQGVPIDVTLAGLPFEALLVERASSYGLFAFHPRDVADVEAVVLRQGGRLDWDYIDTHLRPLAELKGQPEILTVLSKLGHG